MSATIYALPDERDPVGCLRRIERDTGLRAVLRPGRRFVELVPPAPTTIAPLKPVRDLVPAFLRRGRPFNPDPPEAA